MNKLNIRDKSMQISVYYIFLTLLLIFETSCNNSLQSNLTKNNCYWDELNGNKRITFSFKFFEDGTCICYRYFLEGDIGINPEGDMVLPNSWDLQGDNLTIRGWKVKVLRYNSDTLIIKDNLNSTIDTLVKNCKIIVN